MNKHARPEAARASAASITPDDEEPEDLIKISGIIKWYDVAKGYGFVIPDDGQPDVLMHKIALQRSKGYKTAFEGAKVVCDIWDKPGKGLRVWQVLSMDNSMAITPAKRRSIIEATSPLVTARCTWFNLRRGYGFVTEGKGTPDIFVHMETLRRFGMTDLRPDQTVLVRYGEGPKGRTAVEIRPGSAPKVAKAA